MNNERELGGQIEKLVWGLTPPLPSFGIKVGGKKRLKDGGFIIVTEIVEDRNTFIEYGDFEYLVFGAKDGKKENQVLVERYMRKPDKITYFTPDGQSYDDLLV